VRGARPSGTATVLFTDLVGSTDLLSRLGEVAFDEVRRAHFATLREVLARHGGEEVKTLGDGVLAVFGSAADAVSCAVGIQQAVDRRSRSGPAALLLRVGVALGDVSFEEEDVFGTPVVEAARLVAAARPGQILATAAVRWAGGSRSGASFTDRGVLELKGLPEPVPTCEVLWERSTAASIPLPTLLTDLGRIFVGRAAEVERLSQLWKDAGAGERRVALLAGEPGIGKTRLAAELAAQLHDEGATVLAGRCDEDLGVPYQPFVEALRHFVDHTPAGLQQRLGRYGSELARLVPELSERVSDLAPPLQSDPETERYRLFDAVAGWMAAASSDQPVLLVLDDLQWAAKPTLLLLRHVVRSSEAMRLLVVGTYRDSELDHDHPLLEVLADLRRQREVERFPLVGLDSSGVAAFVEQASGQALDDRALSLARAIHLETEGNPFFVREVMRHLAETDALLPQGDRWSSRLPIEELGIPESVREVVGKRLARLSGEANKVLRAAAVVGSEFEPELVGVTGGFDEEELICALEEATAARLVVESASGRYRFGHALVRDTLYDALTAVRRVALHRRVAEGIETLYGAALDDRLPALAHHWARASAPAAETHKAVAYARRAGDRALAQLAHDEAVAYYRQALELLDVAGRQVDDHQRVELLISFGEAQRRAGDPGHRETLLDAVRRAKEAGDHAGVVRAALANSRGALYSAAGAVDHERIAALEDALSVVGERDRSLRARILANLALELTWSDRERRAHLSGEALILARRHADPAALAEVLIARYYAIAAPDTLTERLANTEELLLLTDGSEDALARSRALALRCRVAMESGDVAEADGCLRANEPLTADLGQPALRWVVALQRVGLDLVGGRLEQAETQAISALELGESSGQPDAGFMFVGQLAAIRAEQGRLGELIERLRLYIDELPTVRVSSSLLALALAETGCSDEAQDVFDGLARSDFVDIPFNAVWLRAVTDCAVVCCRLGDVDRAGVLHSLLAPYADQLPVFALGTPNASVSYFLGLLAAALSQWEVAGDHFSAAEAIHGRIGAPIWLARTRLEWTHMLLRRGQRGDAERARELLGQALATARELGLDSVERRAVALLEGGP
jgi:class 3 adenylate cyclase